MTQNSQYYHTHGASTRDGDGTSDSKSNEPVPKTGVKEGLELYSNSDSRARITSPLIVIRNGETCKKMGCPFPAFIAKYWRMQSTSQNKPLLALLRTCVCEVVCEWFKFLSEATCECLPTPLHQKHTTSSLFSQRTRCFPLPAL